MASLKLAGKTPELQHSVSRNALHQAANDDGLACAHFLGTVVIMADLHVPINEIAKTLSVQLNLLNE